VGKGSVGVAGTDDTQGTILLDEPGPTRAEGGGRGVRELSLEFGEGAKRLVDRVGEGTAGLTAAVGAEAVPVKTVVPDLSGVVEDSARALLDEVFERHVGKFCAFDRGVQLADVSEVMFSIVELQGLLGDMGLEGVSFVGEFWIVDHGTAVFG